VRDVDVRHLGVPLVICCHVLDDVIVDPGPESTLDTLLDELGDFVPAKILLTHIHLDHAGAAGVVVREHPRLQVHVSGLGAPHLVDPSRLERSARRLYGEEFDALWGELAPVPAANVHAVRSEVLGLECFPSPGHASHHVCYLDRDGTLYAGDAAGVRIQPSRSVLPPTPPPDADVEAWLASIEEIERRGPARLALIHFGVAGDPERHLAELRVRLEEWSGRVRDGVDEGAFVAAAEQELAENGEPAGLYEQAMPFWQSYAGLARYWEKRREREAAV
jgi:glyoxylase-like metal-dependent hydrolase (beta-lactamase superfamily II)